MGTVGSVVGGYCFVNTVSGTACLAPVAGALGNTTAIFPAFSGTVSLTNLSESITGTKNYTSGHLQIFSGAAGAFQVQAGVAYTGCSGISQDGWINRPNTSSPFLLTICAYNGTTGKQDTIPTWDANAQINLSGPVSPQPLFSGTGALQVWLIVANLTLTAAGSCSAGNMVLTITWTDDTGVLQSRDIISFPWAATLSAASGANDGTRGNAQKLIRQVSTTSPTYAIAIPTGCTGMTYAYDIHASRLL